MPVKVYIWYPTQKNNTVFSAITLTSVGHVSMQINDTYISHRPSLEQNNDEIHWLEYIVQVFSTRLSKYDNTETIAEKNNNDYTKKYINFEPVKSADSTNYSYEAECQQRGRADKTIVIDGLNEEVMLNYYLTIKESLYHPFNMNCCTFIANVIRSSLDCSPELCDFCKLRYNSSYFSVLNKIFSPQMYVFLYILIFGYSIYSILYTILSLTWMPPLANSLVKPKLSLSLLRLLNFENVTDILNGNGGISLINFPIWTPTLIDFFITEINNGRIDCSKNKNCTINTVDTDLFQLFKRLAKDNYGI